MNYLKPVVQLLFVLAPFMLFAQALILNPALSPDGKEIAFSYQGDIWKVGVEGGRADRLTIHESYEANPVWLPNQQQIAFQSDRYGNNDLYLISSKGGTTERLTYHSASDRVYSATNEQLLFTTSRIYREVEREAEIYQVSTAGGTPSRFMDAMGFDPVLSPDGTKVAFVRGTCRTAREAYVGPANRDVWIWTKADNSYKKLTAYEGNDFAPKWLDNENLLYISAQSGKYNVHQLSLAGTESQLTSEKEWGVQSFSVSAAAKKIVYQYGDQVASMDIASKTKKVLSIDVNSDYRFDPIVSEKVSNNLDEFAVSPNEKLIAYGHRGELFLTKNDKEEKRTIRLTTTSYRERDVAWLNDSTLIYVSDQNGQNDLFMLTSADAKQKDLFKTLKYKTALLKKTGEDEFDPIVSPNGKKVVYRRGRGKLIVNDITPEGKLSNEQVLQDGWDTPQGVSWSPDSKWLAYGLADLNFNQDVLIHSADNSTPPVNVSMHPKYDGSPVWSKDGSKLGFVSQRNNGDSDIWFVWLQQAEWEKSNEKRKREKSEGDSPKEDKSKDEQSKDDKQENEEMTVKIDFDKIYNRVQQVTRYSGNESDFVFDGDGEFIYYAIGGSGRQNFEMERNLYKIKWDGSDKEEVLGGGKSPYSLATSSDGKVLYTLTKGGTLYKVKGDKPEALSRSSQLKINYPEERAQVFEEGWRALNAGFYDPQFHGRDWEALKEKYKPLALKASTQEDFSYVFNLMLGQLNASHMGHRGGDNPKETQSQKSGYIGVEGKQNKKGFEITRILNGCPAARSESKLLVGDIIMAVDQEQVDAETNFYALLLDKSETPVLLEVSREGKSKEVVIWPTSSLRTELYDNWVEDRRKLVDEYSGGKLGYLHIQGMNWTSFERFERELMAAGYGKEGIVIDVRWNGGGWTTDYLMAVLTVRQHAYTVPRGATDDLAGNHKQFKETYPFSERLPLASWTKPSIAICNSNSYSNAEIFSHAYKTLNLGTLVGQPTFGAVISTGGAGLMDGSYVRMPFRAWYVKATEENMEHGPAVPDILVDHAPAYKALKIDPQLKKAVEQLMGEM